MSDRENLIRAEIEQSERTRDLPLPAGAVGVRKNQEQSSVYTLRLPNDAIAALEEIARERDTPASAIARGFILRGLAERRRSTVNVAIERLLADVQALKNLIA